MSKQQTTKTFNAGVIGYGLSAKVFHVPFIGLTKGLRLYGIVQRTPKEGDSAPNNHPSVKHFTSVRDLLADGNVDLVIITTPPDSHYELVEQCLQASKHVLVEKPFVPSSIQGVQLLAMARERQLLLCVYQNRRWDADFLTLQQLLKEDKLGRVYEFNTHFDRYRPAKPTNWKATVTMAKGNGAIFDLGTHLIDQVYVLFGMPSKVYGKFINQREGRFVLGSGPMEDDPDAVDATFVYEEQAMLVHVKIGVMSVENPQPRFWVRGTKGSYHKTGLDGQEDQLRKGGKITDEGFGVDDPAIDGTLVTVQDGQPKAERCPNIGPITYLRFYEMLAKALETKKEADLPVPAEQAVDVLRIIEAVKQSVKEGREIDVQ